MKKALRFIDRINEYTGKAVSFLLLFLIAIVTYEVIARYVFKSPTIWVHELSAMLFGAYIVLAGGYIHYLKAHVAMDIFYNRLSVRKKALLDVITFVFIFMFCLALIWKGGQRALFPFKHWNIPSAFGARRAVLYLKRFTDRRNSLIL